LHDATSLQAWLDTLPPRLVIGQRLSCTDCPVVTFLKAHGVPVDMVDPGWITLTHGQQVETPGWMACIVERIDTGVTLHFDDTTLNLEVTAQDLRGLCEELDND